MLFSKKNNIVYSVNESTETGILLSDTSTIDIGGTFTVEVKYNYKSNRNLGEEILILNCIDNLDHSTITNINDIKKINQRYFIVDLTKIKFINGITVYAHTLASLLQELPQLECEITSVEVTQDKYKITILDISKIKNCIIEHSTQE